MDQVYTKLNVGGGLLPIAVYQHQMYWLTLRYREQVESSHRPSHIFNRIEP